MKIKKFSLEEYLAHPEKKVVTKEGAIVRILCTDRHSKHGQIVGLVGTNEKVKLWSKDGQYDGYLDDYDLFFADEEELTEFEKAIKDMGHSVMFMTTECIKQKAKELLELAKKELCESGEVTDWYAKGKAEALKGLPKWRHATKNLPDDVLRMDEDGTIFTDFYVFRGEYYIPLSELRKLPKED